VNRADTALVASLSIKDILEALRRAPELWPVLRDALLRLIDSVIAATPEPLKASLVVIRDQIAAATVMPLELIEKLLLALKDALLSANWGPATGADSDLA